MKKFVCLMLSLILMFSLCTISVSADNAEKSEKYIAVEDASNSLSNTELVSLYGHILQLFVLRGIATEDNAVKSIQVLNGEYEDKNASVAQTLYTFGQGTFVVGLDLKPGTYDITCKSTSDDGLSSSMSDFSDIYSGYGMDDFADMFGSLGTMYDTISGMTVTTYTKNGIFDNYLTLKLNETARIILEDGGKLELSGGTAELTWIR